MEDSKLHHRISAISLPRQRHHIYKNRDGGRVLDCPEQEAGGSLEIATDSKDTAEDDKDEKEAKKEKYHAKEDIK